MSALTPPDLLGRLLNARATAQVEAIMAGLPIVSPEQYQWLADGVRGLAARPSALDPVGMDRGNGGRIKLAGEPMNPLAERSVNGMESLIELARLRELKNPGRGDADQPARRGAALLRLPANRWHRAARRRGAKGETRPGRQGPQEPLDHSRPRQKSKQFAVTIRDHGMGQVPAMMHKTLLSLGRTDKADKPYLIGVFGQGGSSAFSISEYSIVVTRRAADIRNTDDDAGAGWSIVREIQPKGRRDPYYAYLAATEDGAVPRVDAAEADKAGFFAVRSSATSSTTSARRTSRSRGRCIQR